MTKFSENKESLTGSSNAGDSFLGEGTIIKGTLKLRGKVTFEGIFNGKIISEGEVIVSRAGKVTARISADAVQNAGEITGNIVASKRVQILPGGKVDGNIKTPALQIDIGAVFIGKSEMPPAPPQPVPQKEKEEIKVTRKTPESRQAPAPAAPTMGTTKTKKPLSYGYTAFGIALVLVAAWWLSEKKVTQEPELNSRHQKVAGSQDTTKKAAHENARKKTSVVLEKKNEEQSKADRNAEIKREREKKAAEIKREAAKKREIEKKQRLRQKREAKKKEALERAKKKKREKRAAEIKREAAKKREIEKKQRLRQKREAKKKEALERAKRVKKEKKIKAPEKPQPNPRPKRKDEPKGGKKGSAGDKITGRTTQEKKASPKPQSQDRRLKRELPANNSKEAAVLSTIKKSSFPLPATKNKQAIKQYQKLLKVNPDDAAVNLKLANLYFISGYEKLAELSFSRQENIEPDGIEAKNNQGFREFRKKKYEKALNIFKEVLLIDPGNFRARFGVVTVYAKQSFFLKAIHISESALKNNPLMAPFQNKLASLYGRKRMKLSKAILLSQSSLVENPLAADYLSTLANLYYLKGEKTKAITTIKKAIRLWPENKLYKTQLWKFKNT